MIATGMLVYAFASAGAAMSTSYPMLLACRGLQGMCAGAGLVVGRAVIRDSLEGPAAQKLMSRVMMIFGVAPVIAPMVGALLLSFGGWHGIFWVLTAFTALLSLALLLLLEETHPPAQRKSFKPRSLLASYASFSRDPVFWPLLISSSVNFCRTVSVYLFGAAHRARAAASVGGGIPVAVPAGRGGFGGAARGCPGAWRKNAVRALP